MLRLSRTKCTVLASRYCIANSQATRANPKADRSGVAKVKWRPAFGSTAQKTLAVPRRSYSLSRRASRPGLAGEAGRRSACKVTGFSSKQTTGSAGSYCFSYVSSTSSILEMYSSLSSATHHIFFPPRLEVVVEEQDPNGFSSHPGDQPAFDRFLRHQPHRPAGAAFRRIATHHCNDPLLLGTVEHGDCAGTLFFKERRFQTVPLVTTRNRADGLGSERDDLGNPRCTGPFGQLQERQCAQDDPNLLHTAA